MTNYTSEILLCQQLSALLLITLLLSISINTCTTSSLWLAAKGLLFETVLLAILPDFAVLTILLLFFNIAYYLPYNNNQ